MKQFHVLIAPDKLRKYDITLASVIEAIDRNNQNTGGSIIERGGQGFAVRGLGAIKSEKDIENIVLTSVNGVPVFVSNVASVEIAPPTLGSIGLYSTTSENR